MCELKERYRAARARLDESYAKSCEANDEMERLFSADDDQAAFEKQNEFCRILDGEEEIRAELVSALKEVAELAEFCGLTVGWPFEFGADVIGRRIDVGDDEEMERKEAA